MADPKSCLLVALLWVFSKHRPISDSLYSVIMPHTPRHAAHTRTSVWKPRSSFELTQHKVDSSSSREGAPWSPHPYKAQTGRNATSWAIWSRALITMSTLRNQLYGPRLCCDLGLSNSWISPHYKMEESGQCCLAIIPNGLTTFLMFLCYKWSYFKSHHALTARNNLLPRIAQTWISEWLK